MTVHEEAIAALDAKKSAQAQLAAAANCPPWRHAAFALLMGALVYSPAIPLPERFALLALILAAIGLIVQSDRRRLGMFINGYRGGKTRLVVFPILAIELGLYFWSFVRAEAGDRTTPILLALLMIVVGYFGSVLWQRVFAREMGV
jgi:hypothetical protein